MTDEQTTVRTGSQIISEHCPFWHLTDPPGIYPVVDRIRGEVWDLIRDLAQELDRVTGATEISDIL